MNTWIQKSEKFFGGLRLAVCLLLVLALCLVVGTLAESYYGTDFANRLIYKSSFFMVLLFLLFISIFMAALLRLPPKKNLYGFYTVHLGLLTILSGSFITYYAGVDGMITLFPGEKNHRVELNQEVFSAQWQDKKVEYQLPLNAFPQKINEKYEDLQLLEYLPFADYETQWLPTTKTQSAEYELKSAFFNQKITLSLHPQSSFPSSQEMGPLQVHYLSAELLSCFEKAEGQNLVFWDSQTKDCFIPPSTLKGKDRNRLDFVLIQYQKQSVKFYPAASPLPRNPNGDLLPSVSLRLFNKEIFEKSPHLFLIGLGALSFDKEKKKWTLQKFSQPGDVLTLPWMGMKLTLLKWTQDTYPLNVPVYKRPVPQDGELVVGKERVLQVKRGKDSYWISAGQPMILEDVSLQLKKKLLYLPYQFELLKFKMDQDPGTNNPASYESFVRVTQKDVADETHHVYMNHPFKKAGFTFYQASYFPLEDDPSSFATVLSVNFDPGRPFKYVGAVFLVFGAIWHYIIKRRKKNEALA